MKKIVAIVAAIVGFGSSQTVHAKPLDYDQLILLDAEDLAETGIKEAYERVKVSLKKHIPSPSVVKEEINNDAPTYAVITDGVRYEIYGPKTPEGQSWGNATFAFFSIVNRQLEKSAYKFYAINGGNDLGGMFLTKEEYKAAIASIKRKLDWPYIPTKDKDWYGQSH